MTSERKPRAMPMAAQDKFDALTSYFSGGEASKLRQAFGLMEIAEVEIESVYPRRLVKGIRKPSDPPGLFTATAPTEGFYLKSEKLYRHHVRELIERSRAKRPDYSIATKAEVLIGILEASKMAPLTNGGMLLAERLYAEVIGSELGVHAREQWDGQYEELLSEARRKVRTGRKRDGSID